MMVAHPPAPGDTKPRMPRVSIVTPSFNQAEFIKQTIESVLQQDYPAIEYIVMDGGSTDGTLDILRTYDGRLTWVSEPDDGQSDAIDRGFSRADGEILAWLNADDVYLPGAVSSAVRTLVDDASVGFVYGRAEFIDRRGSATGQFIWTQWDVRRLISKTDFIPQPAVFFTREAYVGVGGLDRDLHYCMDYDLWIKVGLRYQVRQVPEFWAQMRMYRETKTAAGGLERVAEIKRMIGRHGRSTLPDWIQWDFVRESWRAGLASMRGRRLRDALTYWGRAIPYLPSRYVVVSAVVVARRRVPRLRKWLLRRNAE